MTPLPRAPVKSDHIIDGEESWRVVLTELCVPGCGKGAGGPDWDETGNGVSHEDAGERCL